MALDEETLARAASVVSEARDAGVTLGTAESCTGGLVAGSVTSIAGSSEVLLGGIVSYACSVKESVLGVPSSVIDGVGAVSSECAAAMAEGARSVLGCDMAVSVTGIAGPGGAEPGKPVGTVWFGLASPRETSTDLCTFDGNRDQVRECAVRHALDLLHGGIVESGACR